MTSDDVRVSPANEHWHSNMFPEQSSTEVVEIQLFRRDPALTAFEPESRGQLVSGLPFHKFYFDLGGFGGRRQTTMVSPHVRIMGDVAIVAYVRLIQRTNSDGTPTTQAFEETRVWQRTDGRWRNVHFHRSKPGE